MRRLARTCGLGLVVVAGCLENQPDTVPNGPAPAGWSARPVSGPVGSTEAAARVDGLGRQILAANPQVGARPLFHTIGAPQPEIFHRGTADVWITEGLVRRCTSDGQLAALLCLELGKMVAEREAATPASVRNATRLPPIDVSGGRIGAAEPADMTRMAELARYDKERQRERHPALPPDPKVLARTYLVASGYRASDLDAAAPLLRAAEQEGGLERQITSPPEAPATGPAPAGGIQLGAPTGKK